MGAGVRGHQVTGPGEPVALRTGEVIGPRVVTALPEQAGADEEDRRDAEPVEDGQRVHDVVAVTVIEGDENRGAGGPAWPAGRDQIAGRIRGECGQHPLQATLELDGGQRRVVP
jgi:hypothetical protein